MPVRSAAERIALRSRWVTIAGLVVLSVLAWLFLLREAGGGAMADTWPPVALMWAMMMIAMMLPSAAPAILLYAAVHRRSEAQASRPPTTAYLIGYLACWTGFAMLAAALQVALQRAALASPMTMALVGQRAMAALLIAAGFYQLSPFKNACLGQCRSPAQFLVAHYRPGVSGALQLGLLHGAYCVGCCWLLMALLFVGGVMTLAWVAGLAVLVALEKLTRHGEWIARIAGVAMIGGGLALLLS